MITKVDNNNNVIYEENDGIMSNAFKFCSYLYKVKIVLKKGFILF